MIQDARLMDRMAARPISVAILAIGILGLVSPALSQPSGVVVKTMLDPAAGAVVGQSISLYVDVLFPDMMPRPPRVSVPDAPGAQIMRFESQGVTIRESIGQQSYVGQRFTFAVLPRRGGDLAIPAPEVTLLSPGGDVTGAVKGKSVALKVAVPPGIDASGPVIASGRVVAAQTWAPDPTAQFTAGGALVRTITREAADVPALGMPELLFAAPDGVRAYGDPPVSEDRVNRGSVTGHRTDKVTYVFERSGTFDLPSLSQPWWDLGTKSAQSVMLPGVSVTVIAAPSAAASEERVWSRPRIWLKAAAALVAFLSIAALAIRYGWPRAREAWLAWRQHQAASERAARRELRRVARTGDAAATYRALMEWKTRRSSFQADQLDHQEPLQALASQLERSLFGRGGEPWTPQLGRRLVRAVSSLPRDRSLAQRSSALPPLNPIGRS